MECSHNTTLLRSENEISVDQMSGKVKEEGGGIFKQRESPLFNASL